MAAIHTVFGAGQIGTKLARRLAAEGHRVRLVRRGAPGPAMPNVEWIRGDASERSVADLACRGAATVYNCASPEYHRWDGVLEPLFRSIWFAAGRVGARLVQLDNVYMVGRPDRVPFDESTPMRPCSKKGELRARLAEELQRAHERGDVRATTGRACDFFGPDTPSSSTFRPAVYAKLIAGGTVYMFGDPDMPHSYSYSPDVARGLAILGTRDEAEGRVWHLPVAAQVTTRELFERFARAAGSRIKVRGVPRLVLRTVGLVSPLMAAVAEMVYQWEVPYLLDDGAFRRTFGVEPTPLDEAVGTTLAAWSPQRQAA